MLLKKVEYPRMNEAGWEEIPQEEVWEDGELNNQQVMLFIYNQVILDGKWKLIRRIKS